MGLIVDNFAGGGGVSTGIEMALGRPVDLAINHSPAAVAMHRVNHPSTRHFCQNIWQVDPRDIRDGQEIDFAWFSPDCTTHSRAKGAVPIKRDKRDLAWTVVHWINLVRPSVIMLENVWEFRKWGPIDPATQKPIKAREGEEFEKWCRAIRRRGYKLQIRKRKCCDSGAPTSRERLFAIARCDGRPIVWPEPTHGAPDSPKVLSGRLQPWRTAAEVIDFDIPCPSIFERDSPLVENSMARIFRGIHRFVIEDPNPFIIPVTHAGGPNRVHAIDEPIRTITTARRGEFALVSPSISRQFGCSTGQRADSPVPSVTAGGGGKTALIMAFLAQHNGGETGQRMKRPYPTIMRRGTQTQVVTSHLVKYRGTCKHGATVRAPMPTVTASGTHIGEVRAFLTKYYSGGGTSQSLKDPMHTLTSKARMGLVTVHGEEWQISDVGMRMLTARELFRAQGFPEDYQLDVEFNGKPMTKTAQIELCGNSVPPQEVERLVSANCAHLIATSARAAGS